MMNLIHLIRIHQKNKGLYVYSTPLYQDFLMVIPAHLVKNSDFIKWDDLVILNFCSSHGFKKEEIRISVEK